MQPGFGFSPSDRFIAWIDEKSKLLRRLQFTLDGVETTKGADVQVTFSNYQKTSKGTIFPTHYLERIVRPIPIKAHEWQLYKLKADNKDLISR